MVKLNGLTRKLDDGSQLTNIGEYQQANVSSSSSPGSKHHQEGQMNNWGDEIHTNVHEFPLLSWDFFQLILPSAKDNLWDVSQ
jgi:hypothetical protein